MTRDTMQSLRDELTRAETAEQVADICLREQRLLDAQCKAHELDNALASIVAALDGHDYSEWSPLLAGWRQWVAHAHEVV